MVAIALGVLRPYWSYASTAMLALLCWHLDARAVANAEAMRHQAATFRQAQQAADVQWQARLAATQAEDKRKAGDAQSAYNQALGAAHVAALRYIEQNGRGGLHADLAGSMQPGPGQGGGNASPGPAQAGDPGLPAAMPTNPVMVSADDVQRCTAAASYALAAHDWAAAVGSTGP